MLRRKAVARPVDILVVCTGNVCRSPYIQAMVQHLAPELVVASAGVGALVGEPPLEEVREELHGRGVRVADDTALDELRARSLKRSMIRAASLVFTATRLHRLEVVRMVPSAAERTFTLKEFARLIADLPAGFDLEAAVMFAARAAVAPDSFDHDDDIDDPYRKDRRAYTQMAADIDAALEKIIPILRRQ